MNIGKLGFGVYKITDEEKMKTALQTAIDAGYRLIDTATYYKNEAFIGDFLKTCKLKNELVITTKIWPSDMSYDDTLRSFEESHKLLDGKIDILLSHWPHPEKFIESYKAMERLKNEGAVKEIGVCNFKIHHLEKLKQHCSIKPFFNQVELHPKFSQPELRSYLKKEGIQVEAWMPIAKAKYLDDEILLNIARKYNMTSSQVILNWHIQRGIYAIPKSETPSRIIENFNSQSFILNEEDLKAIDMMDEGVRFSLDPDDFPYDKK
ncbi:aldo/keto reductase [Streptobacillus moniliformis]|uniref:Aldo/keto reductase n=1 Tax=Streptobacillus moniliformis (strain ATCC 14647 / DSM 12112 / NCTC 10651 / 9901) TaxID=519441 RepID=D1AVI1_STRM9|nr:aldo/keto reductase [Streptobacillus moniliformis]ACZ01741.1 aldo/keto reductase [Streptobacillus moniliformis DSM 12112]AVL43267.1 aldo/keto reductase [Streptobacillus moniliformis]SQA13077.1 Glyoxal reductase [Streptobacillus moniliformis]